MGVASYYADGEVIPLLPTNLVAVDLGLAAKFGVPSKTLDRLDRTGRHLRRGMVLVDVTEVGPDLRRLLDHAGAAHPVFRNPTGALTVLLPEIRVEAQTAEAWSRIQHELDHEAGRIEVVRADGHRLVLRPASGRGMDALDLANAIYERAAPAMSQPRLLRLVDRPA